MPQEIDNTAQPVSSGFDPGNLTQPRKVSLDDEDDAPAPAPAAASGGSGDGADGEGEGGDAPAPKSPPGGEEDPELQQARAKFTPEQQAVFDAVIARKTARFRSMEESYKQQLAQQQAQAQQQAAPPAEDLEPEIPELPPVWRSDYDEQRQAREDAIAKHAAWRARQELQQQQAQSQQQAQTRDAAAALNQQVVTYATRATEQGIAPDALREAGTLLTPLLDPQVQMYVLQDPSGPSITMYLADHPEDVMELRKMSPIAAAAHIAAVVKPKAVKRIKPKDTGPLDNPAPSGRQGGKGGPRVTFE